MAAGGVAQAVGLPLLSGSALAGGVKPCAPSGPWIRTTALAVAPNRRTIWTTDGAARTITAHRAKDLARGRSIDVGGAPVGLAIAPNGLAALVTTAWYDRPGLAIVDLVTGQVDRLDVGPEPGAIAYSRDGRVAYVAGGGAEGTLTRIQLHTAKVHPPVRLGTHVRGLAVHPKKDYALVALAGESAVAVVDVRHGRVKRRIHTLPFPGQIAISPDGSRALVTHGGFGEKRVTPLDLVHFRARRPVKTGLDPAGVAYGASGTRALVANAGAGTVSVLSGRTGRPLRHIEHGGSPRGVSISGSRGIVTDGDSGALTAVRIRSGH